MEHSFENYDTYHVNIEWKEGIYIMVDKESTTLDQEVEKYLQDWFPRLLEEGQLEWSMSLQKDN
jgi:hypothetical protein